MSDYASISRPHTADPVITAEFVHVEGVAMTFRTKKGPFVALRDIDLSVQRGDVFARHRPLITRPCRWRQAATQSSSGVADVYCTTRPSPTILQGPCAPFCCSSSRS